MGFISILNFKQILFQKYKIANISPPPECKKEYNLHNNNLKN